MNSAKSKPVAAPQTRHSPHRRQLTIIAQDPSVKDRGAILRARVLVPYENMSAGPTGYRVQVVDYDASSDTLLEPWQPVRGRDDPFERLPDARLLNDPAFHQQNVYAIVMRTLSQFEHALGRRVSWSFGGHQLKVAPHAFSDANAFYSQDDEALYFGYFAAAPKRGRPPGTVFSCLSHDVVAHETTHALLDGLRPGYTEPSSPDQAAFHEGFSDIVALLSMFSLPEVLEVMVRRGKGGQDRVQASDLTVDELKRGAIFSLADEMGEEMSQVRGKPLRRSTELEPRPGLLNEEEFLEEHRRGEVIVAAVLGALIETWSRRVRGLAQDERGSLDLARVVEEGRLIADRLLTMCIRALDYCPPVHLTFSDYLSALVTADREVYPDDSRYHLRDEVRASFKRFQIKPASTFGGAEAGVWGEPEREQDEEIIYDRTHFEPMQRDPDEVFRFVWENRKALNLWEGAFTQVRSVRPCVRVAEDGFTLRETVVEYTQKLRISPVELAKLHFYDPGPLLLPRDREVTLNGGGTLIFDEFGRLKFHIHNHLSSRDSQNERIKYLAESGYYEHLKPLRKPGAKLSAFGLLHLKRSLGGARAGPGCGCHPGFGDKNEAENHDHDGTI